MFECPCVLMHSYSCYKSAMLKNPSSEEKHWFMERCTRVCVCCAQLTSHMWRCWLGMVCVHTHLCKSVRDRECECTDRERECVCVHVSWVFQPSHVHYHAVPARWSWCPPCRPWLHWSGDSDPPAAASDAVDKKRTRSLKKTQTKTHTVQNTRWFPTIFFCHDLFYYNFHNIYITSLI